MESVSQAASNVVVLIASIATIVGVMLSLAKASAAERTMVIGWIAKTICIALMVFVIVWFVIKIYQFVVQPGPPSRVEIFVFALSLFNVLAYTNLLIDFIVKLARASDVEKVASMRSEISDLRDQRIIEQANLYTAEQIRDLLQAITSPK